MDIKIEKWLEKHNLPIERLPKKWRLPVLAVVEASRIIYDKSQKETIKPIRVGWEIRAVAEAIAKRHDIEEVRNLTDAYTKIKELHQQIKELRQDIRNQKRKVYRARSRGRQYYRELEAFKDLKVVRVWNFLNKPLWGTKQ